MTAFPISAPDAGPLRLLLAGQAADYLEAARFGAAPCIFVHVPKTAGTSLRAELAARLRPDINIHVDYADTGRSFAERMDEAVARFLDRAGPEGIRFASGHILSQHVARIAARLPQARFITFLRDPVARVVSDYRHQGSSRHPGAAAFRRRVPSLEAYLDLPGERDKAAQHLLTRQQREAGLAACIEHVARRFDFVGIQEDYELSFRIVTTLAGRPGMPRLRENVAEATEAEPAWEPELEPRLARRIRDANPLDAGLHAHFAARLREARPALEAALPQAVAPGGPATPLRAFFAGRFDDWAALAAGPRSATPPPWLFVHVPKTAGSSLAAELAEDLSPYRSLHIDHLDRGSPAPVRYDRAVEQALAAHAEAPFRFASGHVQHRQVARLAAGLPGLRLFTLLRDPVARLVSDYLYQRSPMHPLAEEVRRRVPDFDAFLLLPGQRNRIARHLVPKPILDAGDAPAAIAHIEAHYAFLGLQERYGLGFQALTTLFGRPRPPAQRLRVNAAPAVERGVIAARLGDAALAAWIAEVHALDIAIHRHFAARWAAIARPLEAWLAGRRPAG